jgi:hypothetical protein
MKKLFFFCFFFSSVQLLKAQDKNFWTAVSESSVSKNLFANRYKPTAYKLFQLNEISLKADIASRTNASNAGAVFTLTIPNAEGMPERYKVSEHSVMDPQLAARYPEIRSYAGQGIDEPGSVIYFDVSPSGFHGMILSAGRQTIYIDPVDRNDQYYVVFSRSDAMSQKKFTCLTRESVNEGIFNPGTGVMQRGADDGRLRTYRLALACTGEYAQYFLNGTETTDAQRKAKVLTAMNTLMVRTNGIYERDFGIHMNLIANNDAIIYLNASTDPWTTEWNTKTQQTIDAVIGSANYDIGHLVHKESSAANNNGNAGCIGCVCVNGSKGSAFTSHVAPEGDPFVVDYTTHEMGHQFGANHTFTFSNETGTASQMEPGSGSTIMGYAGITGTNTDVQPHSDDYFHTRSIDQVTTYIKGATGGGCAVVTVTGNATPTVTTVASYTIPRSTPFALTAVGADANTADVLTYTWEQINTGTSSSTIPSATRTTGPAFRSRNNGTNPTRTFPILSSILDGTNTNKWEVLPSVARTLNFRVTVKDNHVGGGNNQTADATVTVSSASGPFAVTAPNTAVSWAGGSSQTITWSVASTTAAPVSCANVKISLSTDGGQTFPTVLIASTPNDGTQALTIPNTATTTARIKVEAVGNIFFDISNTNFTITAGSGCSAPSGLASSAITNTSATVSWTAVSGAVSYDVDYKLNTTTTWTNAATATTSTSVNIAGLTQGTLYDWRVRTNCSAASSSYTSAQFTTTSPAVCNAPTGLTSSAITPSGATVSWAAVSGAVSYAVDYKTNASSTWTNAATATTSTSIALSSLSASTLYDFRVRTNCASGSSAYSAAQFTTTAASGCLSAYEANETQATAASVATSTAISAAIGSATDIDYYRITTTATSNFSVTLTGLPADYDLYFYNSAGTQIGSSTAGSTTSETITLANQAAGTYYARVIGYNGVFSTTVCYTLTIGATAVTGCSSAYDNSTNGTTAGAPVIPFNTNITGLISPSADIDNYKFTITTAGTITLTLGTLPADYDLKLLNSAGTQVGISQNGSTSSETINYTAAAGTYYAQVYGYNNANNASTCYTLKVQLGTATKQDNIPVAAAKASVKIYPNPATELLQVSVKDEIAVNSSLRIIDAKGVVVMEQRMQRNPQPINVSKLTPGFYLVKINNNGVIITEKFIKE